MSNTEQQDHEFINGYTIIVNLEPKQVHQKKLSFDELCHLAFPQGPFGEKYRYTVNCTKDGVDIPMLKGGHIEVEEGMVCNVSNTDQS